jgi:hypothetical protein
LGVCCDILIELDEFWGDVKQDFWNRGASDADKVCGRVVESQFERRFNVLTQQKNKIKVEGKKVSLFLPPSHPRRRMLYMQ